MFHLVLVTLYKSILFRLAIISLKFLRSTFIELTSYNVLIGRYNLLILLFRSYLSTSKARCDSILWLAAEAKHLGESAATVRLSMVSSLVIEAEPECLALRIILVFWNSII